MDHKNVMTDFSRSAKSDYTCPPTRSAHLHCNARSAVQVSGTVVAGGAREVAATKGFLIIG
jgi:hypothetical protein